MDSVTPHVPPAHLPSVFTLWKESVRVYASRVWTFAGLVCIPQVITFVSVALLASIITSTVNTRGFDAAFTLNSPLLYVVLLCGLLLVVLQLFSAVALLVAAGEHGNISIGGALEKAGSFIWRFILVNVWVAVIGSVAFLSGYVFIGVVTAVLARIGVSDTAYWFDLMDFFPYLLSFIVTTYVVCSGLVIVVENTGVFHALERSFELVHHHFWSVVLRLVLLYTAVAVLALGANFIPYVGGLVAVVLAFPFIAIYTRVLFSHLQGN